MQCSRHEDLLRATARQMMAMSDGAPPRVRTAAPSIAVGMPAARALLGDAVQPSGLDEGWRILAAAGGADPLRPHRFDDTFGFSRSVYHPFLLHLYLQASAVSGERAQPDAALRPIDRALTLHSESPDHLPLLLWWAVCAIGAGGDRQAAAVELVERSLAPGDGGVIHVRGKDDLIDAWTFRELVAIHALARLALGCGRTDWAARVRSAAQFHQAHTQPDYTTYQPWGVFAFVLAEVPMFADQQVHDATTQVHVEGGGAGVVPALILADAVAALAEARAEGAALRGDGGSRAAPSTWQ